MDTNVVIELLGGTLPPSGNDWLQGLIDQNLYHLSVINQIELLGFSGIGAAMQTLERFVAQTPVLPLSDAVVRQTINIRKSHRIRLPDAIIAATALTHGLSLVTRNTADFKKKPNLIYTDAHQR